MISLLMAGLIAFSVGFSAPSIAKKTTEYEPKVYADYAVASCSDFETYKESNEESVNGGIMRAPIIPSIRTKGEYENYMQAYFRGLRVNMGNNSKGSCGYVALGMLLSYYDSYLSDDFIEEKYDVAATGKNSIVMDENSPGIVNDIIGVSEYQKYGLAVFSNSDIKKVEDSKYVNILAETWPKSFQLQLFRVAGSLGIINFRKIDEYGVEVEKKSEAFSINILEAISILRKYLDNRNISQYTYTIDACYTEGESVKNFIKENIDEGYPVFTAVFNKDMYGNYTDGHAVICYDYDDTNIYANYGWNISPDNAYRAVEQDFNIYYSAFAIKFNMEHSHARNYKVTIGNSTIPYCYCASPSFHNYFPS